MLLYKLGKKLKFPSIPTLFHIKSVQPNQKHPSYILKDVGLTEKDLRWIPAVKDQCCNCAFNSPEIMQRDDYAAEALCYLTNCDQQVPALANFTADEHGIIRLTPELRDSHGLGDATLTAKKIPNGESTCEGCCLTDIPTLCGLVACSTPTHEFIIIKD